MKFNDNGYWKILLECSQANQSEVSLHALQIIMKTRKNKICAVLTPKLTMELHVDGNIFFSKDQSFRFFFNSPDKWVDKEFPQHIAGPRWENYVESH